MTGSKDLIQETLQAQWEGLPIVEFADVRAGDMLELANWCDDLLHFKRGIAHHLSEPYEALITLEPIQNWMTEGGQHLMRPSGRARLMSRGNTATLAAKPFTTHNQNEGVAQ